ncbi:hypothetical protein Glove_139g192 [Diversispora epigaea]|uniref:Uncharacterized protein n=1 Tax=Diversispora epigaea TaxID=1348612 RepID=A0A397J0D9_9GLOM|nr:hypothetical protein Glove_139g192 [Diversispora epigaea]
MTDRKPLLRLIPVTPISADVFQFKLKKRKSYYSLGNKMKSKLAIQTVLILDNRYHHRSSPIIEREAYEREQQERAYEQQQIEEEKEREPSTTRKRTRSLLTRTTDEYKQENARGGNKKNMKDKNYNVNKRRELIRDIIKMDDGKQILVEIIDPGEIPNRNNEVFGYNEDLNTDEVTKSPSF